MTFREWCMLVAVMALLAAVGISLVREWRQRWVQKRTMETAEETARELENATKVMEAAHVAIEALQSDLAEARLEAQQQRTRADGIFHVIEDACGERDRVWQLYGEMSLGAGNAQRVLFDELNVMWRYQSAMAQKYGFQPREVSPEVKKVVDDFAASHGNPDGARQDAIRRRDDAYAKVKADEAKSEADHTA